MLKIESFSLGPLETNAYLIMTEDESKAIIIDPGMEPERLLARIRDMEIEAVLLTHAHFDHIGGVEAVRTSKGCPVYVHEVEQDWLSSGELNGSLLWPELGGEIRTSPAERLLKGGEQLILLGETFDVYHTPGHSPGSVSFHLRSQNLLFGGDVLFRMSVGRTDLPGGSSRELYASIHDKLFQLEEETKVLPGHGPATTIGYEKRYNPYV
jgi:glyoxylase-like metal-dependent hydrolase (beta-lactamase superfamily II)